MNTTLCLSLTALLLANHVSAQIKIATVDLNKVLNSYHKTKQAEEVLKAQGLDLEKAQKAMVEDYKKASEEYKRLVDSAIQAASRTSVLYASSENDLTEEILSQLNAGARENRENTDEKKEK